MLYGYIGCKTYNGKNVGGCDRTAPTSKYSRFVRNKFTLVLFAIHYVCEPACACMPAFTCIIMSVHIYYASISSICLHSPVYACIHLCMPAFTCVCLHSPVYACIHLCMPAFTCVCLHSPVYACIHLCMPAFTCVCLHSPVYACIHLCMPAFTWCTTPNIIMQYIHGYTKCDSIVDTIVFPVNFKGFLFSSSAWHVNKKLCKCSL